jgi:2-keto-4-pentenoate hydratase/2-oxohepta-3-ene-1,7-dioic acid hydratase in catechol pathway
VGGTAFELTGISRDIDGDFFASDGIARTVHAVARGELPVANLESERIGAPIARPGAVICIGQNYAAHAAESGAEPPTEPIIFFKHPNTVVGPYDDVIMPPAATQVDWEVELGVVIGKRARRLASRDAALDHIAGYVVCNDVSEREFQLARSGGQWSKGKSFETFNPVGPVFVAAADLNPGNLRIWSTVNGERRQDSTTRDMIFDVAEIVRQLSHCMVLDPGDLIETGTPEGVALSGRFPYLRDGDVMELGIDGLGVQRQAVRSAD